MTPSRVFGADGTLDVSRETIVSLQSFASLVEKWNPTVNLVSRSTISDIWERHILDSAQLIDFCSPSVRSWLDIGSGGGFPGIVVAVLAKELFPKLKICLVESDQRKCAFLAEATRVLNLDIRLISERVEVISPASADIVSARALAPLDKLVGLAARHLSDAGQCLFLKGASYKEEVDAARQSWRFKCDISESRLAGGGAILKISEISHG